MDLDTTISRLRGVLREAQGVIPAGELRFAEQQVEEALTRRGLAGGHTVVALVGGTGSGKSSMFNALTGGEHADVGVLRPTTRRPTACTWGEAPRGLLDHLGIAESERITRDTLLAHAREEHLEGLVLLDLPDQDSIAEGHAGVVDRLVPLVDLLVWMVDPQKYADHVLHERYLGPLAARADSMIVVVNHADSLTEDGLGRVLADVHRILGEGGLGEVPVLSSSVASGAGVEEVRTAIAEVVAEGSRADATARAQVAGVANWLSRRFADGEADLSEEAIEPTVDALVRASGTDAVAESIERSLSRISGAPVANASPPARPAVAAIGSGWAGHATHGLPKVWAREVERKLPSVESLTHAVGEAVESVPLPEARVRRADQLLIGAGIAFALAVVVLAVGAIAAWPWVAYVLGAVAFVALAGALAWRSLSVRAEEADRVARGYSESAREGVREAVDRMLVEPTGEVLERHRSLREALASMSS
ncbi:MAG: 50S ribosome-binding GTPase [bacterium]|nr:50S ribosome-binding GTPase [bacterium]